MTELATTNGTIDITTPGTELEVIKSNLPEVSEALASAYPGLNADMDLAELMESALGEDEVLQVKDLIVIKVPSGEIDTLQVPDRNGVRTGAPKGVTGVPVAVTPRRSMWLADEPNGSIPDCTSRDGKFGKGLYGVDSDNHPTGDCKTCPMNKRGSAGKGTPAAKCKEQRLIFLLTGGNIFPLLFVVPPGSIKNFKKHGAHLSMMGREGPIRPELGYRPGTNRGFRATSWMTAEITISLEKAENGKGQKYNQLTFTQVRELDDDEIAVVNMYARTIDEMIAAQADALDEMADEAAGDNAGTSRGPQGADGGDVALDDLDDEVSTSSSVR